MSIFRGLGAGTCSGKGQMSGRRGGGKGPVTQWSVATCAAAHNAITTANDSDRLATIKNDGRTTSCRRLAVNICPPRIVRTSEQLTNILDGLRPAASTHARHDNVR